MDSLLATLVQKASSQASKEEPADDDMGLGHPNSSDSQAPDAAVPNVASKAGKPKHEPTNAEIEAMDETEWQSLCEQIARDVGDDDNKRLRAAFDAGQARKRQKQG